MKAGDRVMTVAYDGRLLLGTIEQVGLAAVMIRQDDGFPFLAALAQVHEARCVICGCEILPEDSVQADPAVWPFGLEDFRHHPAHTNCCHRAAIDAADAKHAAQ